jgi:DNA polymerase-3 subunit epsilon
MREIVLDTETTGLDPLQGHRLVEVGCIELLNRIPTGATFHSYLNPEREVPAEAFAIHGLATEFLKDKPRFADIAEDFLSFIGDAPLVIHNAGFDHGFLIAELKRVERPPIARERLVDTLLLARRKHPAGPNRLDDLCARYGIDNSRRTKHGALLDAEILAEVYLELIGARQAQLGLAESAAVRGATASWSPASAAWRWPSASARPIARHTANSSRRWAKKLCGGNICRTAPDGSARRRHRAGRLHLAHLLAIETDEIHRIEQQRREAAIAHGGGDDFAREREQQARTFDQHDRVQVFRRDVLDAEHACEFQVEAEHQAGVQLRLAVKLERYLDVAIRQRLGIDIDLNGDLRLLRSDRRQRLRRVRVLEREILDVLRHHLDLRLLVRHRCRAAIGRGHENS